MKISLVEATRSGSRVRILVIVGRVHFLQKGILNPSKKRWERPTPSTLSESFPTLF